MPTSKIAMAITITGIFLFTLGALGLHWHNTTRGRSGVTSVTIRGYLWMAFAIATTIGLLLATVGLLAVGEMA